MGEEMSGAVSEPSEEVADETDLLVPPSEDTHTDRKGVCTRLLDWVVAAPRLAYNSGVLCCILSQFLFATLAVLIKLLYQNGIPVFESLFLRSTFIAIACAIVVKNIQHKPLFGPRQCWGLLAINAVVGGISTVAYFMGNTLIPVGDATALSKLSPLFNVLLSCIFGWEATNLLMIIGSILCCIGAVVISHPPLLFGGSQTWDSNYVLGGSLSLGAAILRAIIYLVAGRIGTRTSEFSVAMSAHLLSILVLLLPLALSFPSPPVFRITGYDALLLLIASPTGLLANCFLVRGIQLCDGVKGSSVVTIGIVFSYLLGLIVLKENLTAFAVVGSAVIMVGIWTVSVGKARALRAKSTAEQDVELTGILSQSTQKTETGVQPKDPEGGDNSL